MLIKAKILKVFNVKNEIVIHDNSEDGLRSRLIYKNQSVSSVHAL